MADVIDRVSHLGGHDRVVVIWGQPGVGKSQLAVEAAHRLSERHPDGACHVDLQGYSANRLSAEQVAARLLGVLDPESELPAEPGARFAACREVLRRGRYVVVLDNAGSTAQIRELLPGPCDTTVLVTSRSSLTTMDASLVELDVLDTASAIALIRRMVDRDGGPGAATTPRWASWSGSAAGCRSRCGSPERCCGHDRPGPSGIWPAGSPMRTAASIC
nr:hypothetical protein GCM10020093_090970 [Planobispora longispora]